MASEPTDDEAVTVTLPSDLGDWLDAQASHLGVDRETVLVQLLASYRTAAELDGDLSWDEGIVLDPGRVEELETAVAEDLAGRVEVPPDVVEEQVAGLVSEYLDQHAEDLVRAAVEDSVAAAVEAQVGDQVEAVRGPLAERMDGLESDYTRQLEDVRERVIQVKKETDGKAAADHDHDELDRVDALADDLDALQETVDELQADLDAMEPDDDDLDERVGDLEDRLKTVAWVVSDLRDAQEQRGAVDAVDRIKRAAAQADVQRANCESCGNGVAIALLTEPECPHCNATVTDIDPSSGFFSSPRLLVASQLESGED